jgi:adhesin transport system outer membrane protein
LFLPVAHGASAETLDDAVSYAIDNHPSISAASAGTGIAKETVHEEMSAYYPTSNANISFGRVFANNTTTRGLAVVRGTGYSWYGEGRASINQKIYDWSETGNRVKAAKARYSSADSVLNERMQSIEFQATQAYVQMLRAQQMKQMADDHLESMLRYKNRIQILVDNGGADESELSRAQDIISLAENAILQAQADIDIARAGYIEAVGRQETGVLVKPVISNSVMPSLMQDAIDVAIKNHPQIRAAGHNVEAAMYDKKAVLKNILPKFDGQLSYTKKDQDDVIGGESEDARALISMNWDYAFGGAQMAAQRRAALQQQEASYLSEATRRTIERDVRVAWASLDLASKQKTNERNRLTAARETFVTYQEQYEGGQKTILDLMSAEMQIFNAEYAYENLSYGEMGATYALKTILGLGDYQNKTQGG